MSIFMGIDDVLAEGASNRQYFEPGNYTVTIDRVFIHEKRLGGGKLFIVETIVKESDNPQVKIGDRRNWVQTLSSPYALSRIKTFMGAAKGLCPIRQSQKINQTITKDTCEEAVTEKNPLKGRSLTLRCQNKITKSGKSFTQAEWGVV